ncbi:MAG: hypothetical protein Kow0099_12800 [Candidatus Abyssubacteria bacterium]
MTLETSHEGFSGPMLVHVPSGKDDSAEMTPELRCAFLGLVCETTSHFESLGSLIHHEINVPLRKIAQQVQFSVNGPSVARSEEIDRWRERLLGIASLIESLGALCSAISPPRKDMPATTASLASHA